MHFPVTAVIVDEQEGVAGISFAPCSFGDAEAVEKQCTVGAGFQHCTPYVGTVGAEQVIFVSFLHACRDGCGARFVLVSLYRCFAVQEGCCTADFACFSDTEEAEVFVAAHRAEGEDVPRDRREYCGQQDFEPQGFRHEKDADENGDEHQRDGRRLALQRDGPFFAVVAYVGAEIRVAHEPSVEPVRPFAVEPCGEQQERGGGKQRQKDAQHTESERRASENDVEQFHGVQSNATLRIFLSCPSVFRTRNRGRDCNPVPCSGRLGNRPLPCVPCGVSFLCAGIRNSPENRCRAPLLSGGAANRAYRPSCRRGCHRRISY